MLMPKDECVKRVEVFDDSLELAEKLRELADAMSPGDAYWVKEAAENLDGMHELLRHFASHEKKAAAEAVPVAKHPLRDDSVKFIGLSTFVANNLLDAGIKTLGDLAGCTATDLLKQPNLGRKSVNDIKSVLATYGMKLHETPAGPGAA